ncbi:hypothetical protein LSUE1_G003544 [Lachnellula suecica]|uniref:Ubiquitin-like domain-containing protein n=1 Tax=Lachnellula suecica TaxID=602035 RepID=A0A8T9C8U1_9HELO|nr:hypothetical protein LSUE1_G003544 [Lachnellula suecica]
MSVGFGFSAGDFIAAIKLVGTVIDALRSSGQAGSEYRELVSQLLSLETALVQVKDFEFEETQYAEVVALRQAGAQCLRTIDDFWTKAQKYQPSLGNTATKGGRRVKNGWMRIRWVVCRTEDVAQFKADLMGHTQSILLLLATVQRSTSDIHDQRQDTRYKTLAAKMQEGYFGCMNRLTAVFDQGKELLASTAQILSINVKVFQIVLQIQDVLTKIPGQVERQQPVFLIDALGKPSPFHLEFVRSSEALLAVLKANLKHYGNAPAKIDKGQFTLEDSTTSRSINLNTEWETCFYPGQRVDMSMVFYKPHDTGIHAHEIDVLSICPRCNARAEGGIRKLIKW